MKVPMWIRASAVVFSTLMGGVPIVLASSWQDKKDASPEVPHRFDVIPPTESNEEVLEHPHDFFHPSPSMLEGLPVPGAEANHSVPVDTNSPTTIPFDDLAPQTPTPPLWLPIEGLDRTHPIEIQHPLLPLEGEPRHDLRKRK